MSTPTQQQIIDDALMSGAIYVSNRDVINQLPTPTNWTSIFLSGKSGNNIIVTSYSLGDAANDWQWRMAA